MPETLIWSCGGNSYSPHNPATGKQRSDFVQMNDGRPGKTCTRWRQQIVDNVRPTSNWKKAGNTDEQWKSTCPYERSFDIKPDLKYKECRECNYKHFPIETTSGLFENAPNNLSTENAIDILLPNDPEVRAQVYEIEIFGGQAPAVPKRGVVRSINKGNKGADIAFWKIHFFLKEAGITFVETGNFINSYRTTLLDADDTKLFGIQRFDMCVYIEEEEIKRDNIMKGDEKLARAIVELEHGELDEELKEDETEKGSDEEQLNGVEIEEIKVKKDNEEPIEELSVEDDKPPLMEQTIKEDVVQDKSFIQSNSPQTVIVPISQSKYRSPTPTASVVSSEMNPCSIKKIIRELVDDLNMEKKLGKSFKDLKTWEWIRHLNEEVGLPSDGTIRQQVDVLVEEVGLDMWDIC